MKAIYINEFGNNDKVHYGDQPRPEPSGDEILIEVHAAGMNHLDHVIRSGDIQELFGDRLPIIFGQEVAGVVDTVGDQVTDFKPGDEVVALLDSVDSGGYAQYVKTPQSRAASKPRNLSMVAAASAVVGPSAAWQGLFSVAGLSEGQRILINAAAGKVGSFVTQLADWKGAYVLTSAAEHDRTYLEEIGASEVIDYKNKKFEEEIKEPVDVVFDLLGSDNRQRSWQVLKDGGFLVTAVRPDPDIPNGRGLRGKFFHLHHEEGRLRKIVELIEDEIIGVQPVPPENVVSLAQGKEALARLENGKAHGSMILRVR